MMFSMDKYEIRRQRLIKLRDERCNGKAAQVARVIGRPDNYVSRMLYPEGKKGKKRIAEDMAEVIESAFKLPKGWLDDLESDTTVYNNSVSQPTGQGAEVFRIDVLNFAVSAGPGSINNEFVEVLRSVEYSNERAQVMFDGRKKENLRIINVRGDSMSGTIEPGDLLFIDISIRSFDGDGIYAFLYGETAHVKRLQMMKDQLLVLSDNKTYTPWEPITREEMNRVFIFGKVVGSMPQTYRKHG